METYDLSVFSKTETQINDYSLLEDSIYEKKSGNEGRQIVLSDLEGILRHTSQALQRNPSRKACWPHWRGFPDFFR